MDKDEYIELDEEATILDLAVGTRTTLDVTVVKLDNGDWRAEGESNYYATRDGENWGKVSFSSMAFDDDAEKAMTVVMMSFMNHADSEEFVDALSKAVEESEQTA